MDATEVIERNDGRSFSAEGTAENGGTRAIRKSVRRGNIGLGQKTSSQACRRGTDCYHLYFPFDCARISEIHSSANTRGRIDRLRRRRAQFAYDGVPRGDFARISYRFVRSVRDKTGSERSFGVCSSCARMLSRAREQFAVRDGRQSSGNSWEACSWARALACAVVYSS